MRPRLGRSLNPPRRLGGWGDQREEGAVFCGGDSSKSSDLVKTEALYPLVNIEKAIENDHLPVVPHKAVAEVSKIGNL